jgi:molybdopterin synthase sulfur carrier subunit
VARVSFTQNLQRHAPTPPAETRGATVREVLDAALSESPRARDYVLDEHGALRTHIVVFVNGAPVRDRTKLTDPVDDDAEVFVMQALSGG